MGPHIKQNTGYGILNSGEMKNSHKDDTPKTASVVTLFYEPNLSKKGSDLIGRTLWKHALST
jgi:hypothetical protein